MARSPRRPATILAELARVSAQLKADLAAADKGYAKRLRLYEEGRACDPPITQRALADAAQVKEDSVVQALRKARRQNGDT